MLIYQTALNFRQGYFVYSPLLIPTKNTVSDIYYELKSNLESVSSKESEYMWQGVLAVHQNYYFPFLPEYSARSHFPTSLAVSVAI